MFLPFCTPGLRDPQVWVFPSLNKVSPTGSGGEKGVRVGVEGELEPGGTVSPWCLPANSLSAVPGRSPSPDPPLR